MMKLDDLIKRTLEIGVDAVADIIDDVYVPYTLKISDCINLVNATHYNLETGEHRINTPLEFMFHLMRIVDRYTTIDYSDYSVNDAFDELNKNLVLFGDKEISIMTAILKFVRDEEIKMYKTVLDMVKSDSYENERSFAGYLDSKIGRISDMLDKVVEYAEEL